MKITSAMAVTFDWESAGAGLDGTLRIPAGGPGTDYPLTVASKTGVRICLADMTSEFLSYVQSEWNTSIAASGRTITLTLTEEGRVRLAIDSGTYEYLPSIGMQRVTALQGTGNVSAHTADTQSPYIVFFASLSGGSWRPVVAGGAERTSGGRVYAIAATNTSWDRTMKARWVPATTAVQGTLGFWTTPMRPDIQAMSYVGDLSASAGATLTDFMHFARNAVVAFAMSNFQALRTGSATDYYFLGYLGPRALLNFSPTRYDDQWPTYEEVDIDFVLPTQNSSGQV